MGKKSLHACFALVAAAAVAACGGGTGLAGDGRSDAALDQTPGDETAGDPVPDTTVDPARDEGGGDAAVDVPVETELPPIGPSVTFILRFVTDIPGYEYLYAQEVGYVCHQEWVSILDGETAVSIEDDCGLCPCDECDRCAVCGACMPRVAKVGGGGSVSRAWSGVVFQTDRCVQGYGCEREVGLTPGSYTARFCFAVGGPDEYPGGYITGAECRDVPFTYPVAGGVVEYVVNNGG